MIVYRYTTKEEIIKFLNGEMNEVGSVYKGKIENNTHHYKLGERYVHFFKNLRQINVLRKYKKYQKDMYVAKFNIPLLTLAKCSGKGYYDARGYDVYIETLKEFAVPSELLKKEFFVSCIKDDIVAYSAQDLNLKLIEFENKFNKSCNYFNEYDNNLENV